METPASANKRFDEAIERRQAMANDSGLSASSIESVIKNGQSATFNCSAKNYQQISASLAAFGDKLDVSYVGGKYIIEVKTNPIQKQHKKEDTSLKENMDIDLGNRKKKKTDKKKEKEEAKKKRQEQKRKKKEVKKQKKLQKDAQKRAKKFNKAVDKRAEKGGSWFSRTFRSKSTKKTVSKATTKNISKETTKIATKTVAQKATTKATTKVVAKAGRKCLIKKIPFAGAVAGIVYGVERARHGDWLGAGGEVLSGLCSCVPGYGTAASVAIDAGLAARDITQEVKAAKRSGEKTEVPTEIRDKIRQREHKPQLVSSLSMTHRTTEQDQSNSFVIPQRQRD